MFIFSTHAFSNLKSFLFQKEELQNFCAHNTFVSSCFNSFSLWFFLPAEHALTSLS